MGPLRKNDYRTEHLANSVVDLGKDLSALNDVISLFFLLHCAACLFGPI